MVSVPARDTTIERAVREVFERIHDGPIAANDATLVGSPGIVVPGARAVIFVSGCFWHHYAGCGCARIPNTVYPWAQEFARTKARDAANQEVVRARGWRVMTVWGCAVTGANALAAGVLENLLRGFLPGRRRR